MPSKEERREKWKKVGKDKVVLHMYQRSPMSPNGSPFVIKFETYLRMNSIPYEVDFEEPRSSKGKSPWMTFNGEDMADSQFCIEHLAEKLNKDMTKKLSNKEKCIARSLRIMIEDHLCWCFTALHVIHYKGKFLRKIYPKLPGPGFMQGFTFKMILRSIGKQAQAQGIGRHTQAEVERLGLADLKALSEYMEHKPYIMGKEPTEVDATAFGFLCVILAGDPEDNNVFKKAIETDFTNLKGLFDRMKEKYWPDWDECVYVDLKQKEKEEKKKKKEEEKKKKEEEKEKEKKKEEREKKQKEREKKKEEKDKEEDKKKEESDDDEKKKQGAKKKDSKDKGKKKEGVKEREKKSEEKEKEIEKDKKKDKK